MKYLRDQVAQARGMPSKESVVRRLNFCQWVEDDNPAVGRDAWMECEDRDFPAERLRGRKCWAGLDLSSTADLTALVLFFEPSEDDEYWRLVPYFWLPGDGLADKADKDRVPYLAWRDAGYLETQDGRAINKKAVAMRAAEIAASYDLQQVSFDRWRIADFLQICEDEGIVLPLEPFGQGFAEMGPAVDEFERLLVGREIRHNGNPVMTMCAANAVYEQDPAGNRKPSKRKSRGRIDGLVAGIMASLRDMKPEFDKASGKWVVHRRRNVITQAFVEL